MVSQAHGQNDYKEILNIILRNLLFVFTISLLILIFTIFYSKFKFKNF
jgi:MATE family multidrug resistance protein